MKDIFYSSVDDEYCLSVACKLQEGGVNIKSIVLAPDAPGDGCFPEAIMFNRDEISCPEFYENKTDYVLSEDEIKDFIETKVLFVSMSDRFCLLSLSTRRRTEIFYSMLSFWLDFFKKNKFDAVYFAYTPHMGWDTVAHDVAKYLNIQTFHLERTCINDYVVLVDDYKDRGKVPEDYLEGKSIEELMEIVGKDLLIKASEQSYWSPPPGVCK